MAKNIALQALLEQVRDERQMYANTATRVGNALLALLEYIENAPYLRNDTENVVRYLQTYLKGIIVGESSQIQLKKDGSIICSGIHVNGSAVFDELVFNHQNVFEGDTYFSDRAIIDSVEQTDLNQYTLYLRKMFDADEFTFQVGDIIRWSINRLLGKGLYDNGYARVDNLTSDRMFVTLYDNEDCPGGLNTPPVAGCRLVRHGHVANKSRQNTFYVSAKNGCCLFLQGVDKPIIEDSLEGSNYSAWIGLPPDTAMVRDLESKGLINPNQPYSYFRGIIVQDMIQVNYKGVPEFKGRESMWNETTQYIHGYDEILKGYYTDFVWYKGILWKAAVAKPTIGVAPRFNNPDWICVRGAEDVRVEIYSSSGDMFRAGTTWQTTLIASVWHGEMQLTQEEIGLSNIYWTRTWDNGEGDEAWNILHSQGRSSLTLAIDSSVDLPGEWRIDSKASFKITVHLPDYGEFTSEYNILI